MKRALLVLLYCSVCIYSKAQLLELKNKFTKSDTLRGSITAGRLGWDVMHYDITIQPDFTQKTIIGKTIITYFESLAVKNMQIDLQQPLIVDSVIGENHTSYIFTRDSNICWVYIRDSLALYKISPGVRHIIIYYHGHPIEPKRAPWDGGLVWRNDSLGRPLLGTACQGTGASVWWPCKDHQSDEPDSGVIVRLIAPDSLVAVSNGRLQNVLPQANGYKIWNWIVKNPINTYDVTMNIGKYVSWSDTLMGEGGPLDLQYWVLDYNLEKAKIQFEQVKPMIHSHEYWFGKYPFYEDGYKLIETSFLGMEHQSGVAYGNRYQNGYLGKDLSATGHGLKWDFIIVHESGHEWFGNNITTKDIADMWIHEGFTNYSETLYIETMFGKEAAQEYCLGIRKKIKNDIPIIGSYGVNNEGSGDMYYKAANMINMIRYMMHDDLKFRNILRGLNTDFYHQTVTTQQLEQYINEKSGMNFNQIFEQYLRTIQVPLLEYYFNPKNRKLYYHWTNCIKGFNLPLVFQGNSELKLKPSEKWRKKKIKQVEDINIITTDSSYYYIKTKKLTQIP